MDRSETAAASAVEWGGIAPEFPAGLRVLVVDDDATCLKVIERMLKNCLYDVTTCSQAVAALSILRERKGGFDIVLSDVYMPDMDGFKLLELIGLEMDLPVIMMSAEDRQDVVLKGVTHGACDYLIKPIRMEAVKTLWQHVVRKRRNESRDQDHSGSVDDSDRQRKSSEDGENGSSATDGNWKHVKRKKEEEDDAGEEHEDTSTMKKPRVVWTIELHQQFVAAVNQLGVDKAVPKKILEMMNVPVLTRENVASHLQKYRLYLRRVSGGSQRHGRVDTPFSGASETSFGLITSSDGIHLPTLSVSSHVPPQNFSMLQAGPRNGINASIRSNQMSFLNFEKSTMPSQLKSLAGQQLIVGQMNLLNGLPSSMNSQQVLLPTTGLQQLSHSQQMMRPCMGLQVNAGKNIAGLTTSSKICSPYQVDITQGPKDNPLWMQITPQMHNVPIDLHQKIMRTSVQQHPQPRFLMLNEPVPSSILSPIIGRESEVTTPVREQNEVVSSPHMPSEGVCINNASMVCSTSQSPYADYRSNCYPVGGTVTTPNLAPADMFQKSMQTSGSLERQSSAPCYAILNETGKNSQNSKFQNMNYNHQSTNHLSSAQTGLHFGALEVVPKAVQNRNLYAQSQDIIRERAEDKQLQRSCTGEHVDTQQLADNSFKIKIESLHNSGYGNLQIADGFYSDELMKAVTKKQEMVGHGEEEFSIERFFS